MPKRMLPLTLVQKRRGILEAKDTNNRNVVCLINHALNEAADETSTKYLKEFFGNCTKSDANKYYKYGLSMLESYNGKDDKLSRTFIHLFVENIVPYVEDLNALSEELNKVDFNGIDIIKEAVSEYKVADRINRNHNAISKRFDIKKFVIENRNMGLRSLTEEVCRLIDTYNIPDYAKLNNTLEECYYIFGSVYPEYNPKNSISTIVDYYLLRENELPKSTLEAYKRTLENSRVIPKRAKSSVSFLLESKDLADSNDVKDLINQFKKDDEKNSSKLENMVNKIFSNKPENIIDDMPNILGLLRTMVSIGAIAIQPLVGIAMLICNKCINIYTEAKQSEKMLKYFTKERDAIEKKIDNTTNESKLKDLREYRDCLDKCIDKLDSHHRDITGGVDADIEESVYSGKYYTLAEMKIFKHQNLIRAAMDGSKVVELNYHRMKKSRNESNNKLKAKLHHLVTPTPEEKYEMESKKLSNKFKRKLTGFGNDVIDTGANALGFAGMQLMSMSFSESTKDEKQILSIVNDMDELDIAFAAIEFDNPEDASTITNQFTPVMRNLNQKVSKDDLHVYGIASDLALEFHIATNDRVILSDEERELKEHTVSPRDMYYISYIGALAEQIETFYNLIEENANIFDQVSSKINPNVNFEEACILMELYALSPKCKNKEILSEMIDYYCAEDKDKYYKSTKLHQLCDSLISPKLSLQESTEVYQLVTDVLNEATSLTAAKMAMMKLKKNITKANSNVREGMRSMEIAMSGVTRSIEKTLTTDKREQVIKGSVIPSFSKVIKLALVTCAAWAIHPVAGIIMAVGALGASKALNHREKEMVLDEIEVELRVVNREIARCGDTAKPEKYRTLVQYQRRLERERHRIKMSMTTNGRRVPDISMGDGNGDDD